MWGWLSWRSSVLALEPGPDLRVGGEVGRQDLDRHVPPQPRVPGAVDLAHSAGAEGGGDFVRTEPVPGARLIAGHRR